VRGGGDGAHGPGGTSRGVGVGASAAAVRLIMVGRDDDCGMMTVHVGVKAGLLGPQRPSEFRSVGGCLVGKLGRDALGPVCICFWRMLSGWHGPSQETEEEKKVKAQGRP
jgi:hypothetical protein